MTQKGLLNLQGSYDYYNDQANYCSTTSNCCLVLVPAFKREFNFFSIYVEC